MEAVRGGREEEEEEEIFDVVLCESGPDGNTVIAVRWSPEIFSSRIEEQLIVRVYCICANTWNGKLRKNIGGSGLEVWFLPYHTIPYVI